MNRDDEHEHHHGLIAERVAKWQSMPRRGNVQRLARREQEKRVVSTIVGHLRGHHIGHASIPLADRFDIDRLQQLHEQKHTPPDHPVEHEQGERAMARKYTPGSVHRALEHHVTTGALRSVELVNNGDHPQFVVDVEPLGLTQLNPERAYWLCIGLAAGKALDCAALDAIGVMLRDPSWGVGMLEDIAELVRKTGRSLVNRSGESTWDRH